MNQYQSSQSNPLDELLPLLADQHCRATLSYFRDSPEDVTPVLNLANEISKEDHGGTEQIVLDLHHSVLPRLADADAVDYDARSQTIRYRGHTELETLLDSIAECYLVDTEP